MNKKSSLLFGVSLFVRFLILSSLIGIEFVQMNPVSAATTKYDDVDAGWTYTGSWVLRTDSSTSGPYANTIHYTRNVGDAASFTFTGTQFIFIYTQNTNRGNIDVYIDGTFEVRINANGTILYQQQYVSPTFPADVHTVEFRNAGGGGGIVDVDAIEVINSQIPNEPDLTVSLTHTGTGFAEGDIDKTFTITVTNSGNAPTTGDLITVVDTLPAEFTATAMSGTGWNCNVGLKTCTRSDSQDTGLDYPPITLTVDVGYIIQASSLTNLVTVSGGGETNTANNSDSDQVTIYKPDLVVTGYELRDTSNGLITKPAPNQAFNIKLKFKNQGTSNTGIFYPGVFLDDQPNYGPDHEVGLTTFPFGRVTDMAGYKTTPIDAQDGPGCLYYDPTNSIDPLTTNVIAERGNYTRFEFNSSLIPGGEVDADVYIGYSASETEYQDTKYDPYRTGLSEGVYYIYLYADPNCSGGTMESNEENNSYGPVKITVTSLPGVGVGIYDDANSNWSYTGNWTSFASLSGPYNGTVHSTSTVGDSASFYFNGTSFIYKYTQNTDRGNIDVYVDGIKITTINANGTLTSQKTYTSPDYPTGMHLVQFKNAGGGGGKIDVDSIEIINTPDTTTVTLLSTGTYDGWILESSENSTAGGEMNSTASVLFLGDDPADRQYRSILYFNTSVLPDTAVITSATLKLRRLSTVGSNPFVILGALRADLRRGFFGTAALQLTDFRVAANRNNVATFGISPVGGWYSGVLSAIGRSYINVTGATQFRLYFTKGDNDDLGADYIRFASGNSGVVSRPKLVIQYYIP